jgi:hypothetical protein
MNFALFYFGRRGENEKEDVTTKTGTPINYLSIPRGRLYVSTDLNPLPKVRGAVESKVRIVRDTTRIRIIIGRKSIEGQEPIGKAIQSTKSLRESGSNISLIIILIHRQIEIALKLHAKGNPRGENATSEVFHSETQGDKVLMSPELVNSVRSHIGAKLRTFV